MHDSDPHQLSWEHNDYYILLYISLFKIDSPNKHKFISLHELVLCHKVFCDVCSYGFEYFESSNVTSLYQP